MQNLHPALPRLQAMNMRSEMSIGSCIAALRKQKCQVINLLPLPHLLLLISFSFFFFFLTILSLFVYAYLVSPLEIYLASKRVRSEHARIFSDSKIDSRVDNSLASLKFNDFTCGFHEHTNFQGN